MAAKTQPVRRMSTLQELAEQANLHSPDTADSGPVIYHVNGQKFAVLPFTRIRFFNQHPFRLYTGERLADMVESIKENGILTPLIVRRIHGEPDYDYEMLSGHNRMNAGTLAGLACALCMIKENLSDREALMYVIETNLRQRSFKDLLPSEKAAVLCLRYSELYCQGKRNDIIAELDDLEIQTGTCGNGFHRPKSRDVLGNEYELTGRSIANYIRIGHFLAERLRLRLDQGEFTLRDALELSHLKQTEQQVLDEILSKSDLKVGKHASALRENSEAGAFDRDSVLLLLAGGNTHTVPMKKGIKIKYEEYSPFFSPAATQDEIKDTIIKALQFYLASGKGESA